MRDRRQEVHRMLIASIILAGMWACYLLARPEGPSPRFEYNFEQAR